MLRIGSGDVKDLLMGKDTKGYQGLFRKFLSDEQVQYNALASPIDALRSGAILEDAYLMTLGDDYFIQHHVVSKEMDCLACTLDFAKINDGKLVDFDELKTMFFPDFIDYIEPLKTKSDFEVLSFLKSKAKVYYNQVQQQLYVTELDSCNLVYLAVLSYDDDENYLRTIRENEIFKIRVYRDEEVISSIKERAKIFQIIKDNFK
jgi:hypothetical protein